MANWFQGAVGSGLGGGSTGTALGGTYGAPHTAGTFGASGSPLVQNVFGQTFGVGSGGGTAPGIGGDFLSRLSDFARGAYDPSASSAGQRIGTARSAGQSPALGDIIQYVLQQQVGQEFAPVRGVVGGLRRLPPATLGPPRKTAGGIFDAIGSITGGI